MHGIPCGHLIEGQIPSCDTGRTVPEDGLSPGTEPVLYRTIAIDPPWPGPDAVPTFRSGAAVGRVPKVVIPYATMTGVQIAALRVRDIAAPDAQIFLWATSRSLGDAYLLMQGWGCLYRGLFVWQKRMGLGRHVRHDSEFVLWGGRPGAPLVEPRRCPPQSHRWPQKKHSEKPAEAYTLFADLSPPPRLDIFARQARDGWDRWGNEAP